MKCITGVLAGVAMLTLVACTSGDATVASGSAPDTSISAESIPPETDLDERALETPAVEENGGLTGCDLIRADLTNWIDETEADKFVGEVVLVLDRITPLVSKPSRRTADNLLKAETLINSNLARAVQAIPNTPMNEVSATDVKACEDGELLAAYDIAKRPLRDRVKFVISYKILGLNSAVEEVRSLVKFDSMGNQALRKIAGDRIKRSLKYTERNLTPVVDALSLPGLSEKPSLTPSED
jgi:hypothetical protein